MTIYKEYLTESEREFEAFEQECELGFAKIDMMFEMVDMELELALKNSELTAVRESATYDELQAMYEEAVEKAEEKKVSIWQSFKNFLVNIWKKFTGLFKKKVKTAVDEDPDGDVELDKEDEKNLNIVQKALNDIKAAGSELSAGHWIEAGKRIVPILATISGVAVATTITTKVVMKRKEIGARLDQCNSLFEKFRAVIEEIFGKKALEGDKSKKDNDDEARGVLGKLKTFFNKVKDFLKGIGDRIAGVFKKKDDTAPDNTDDKNNMSEEEQEVYDEIGILKKRLSKVKNPDDKARLKKKIDELIEKKRDIHSRDIQKANNNIKANTPVSNEHIESKKAKFMNNQNNKMEKYKAEYKFGTKEMEIFDDKKVTMTINGEKVSDVEVRKTLDGTVEYRNPSTGVWKVWDTKLGKAPSFKKIMSTVKLFQSRKDPKKVFVYDNIHDKLITPKKPIDDKDVAYESVIMPLNEAYDMFGEACFDLAYAITEISDSDYLTESMLDTDDLYAGVMTCNETILKECAELISEL